jgi:hypothetical protein
VSLRHYATSGKVAGSIPDEVIGFFNWPNPSSRTVDPASTHLLTEMKPKNLSVGKRRPERRLTLTPSVNRLFRKYKGSSTSDNLMDLHGRYRYNL